MYKNLPSVLAQAGLRRKSLQALLQGAPWDGYQQARIRIVCTVPVLCHYLTRQTLLMLSFSYQTFCQATHTFQAMFKASSRCRFKQTECAFEKKNVPTLGEENYGRHRFLKTSIFSSPCLQHIFISCFN